MTGVQRIARRMALAVLAAATLLAVCSGPAGAAPVAHRVRLHVTLTLHPRDPTGLRAYARAVSTPGSASYLHYLSPGQFARRFGPTRAHIATVRRALRAHGLRPGSTAAGGLSIPVQATVGQLQRGLSVPLTARTVHGHRLAVAAGASPR